MIRKILFLICLGIFFAQNVWAENFTSAGGDINFAIAAPEGGANVNFTGSYTGNGELSVDSSVYSSKETKPVVQDGQPAGETTSKYSEANIAINGGSQETTIDATSTMISDATMETDYGISVTSNTISYSINGTYSQPIVNVETNGYSSAWKSEDGKYVGGETSSIATANQNNIGVPITNVGIANAMSNDQNGVNTVTATGYGGYNVDPNVTALTRGEAGTWLNVDQGRISVTAISRSKTTTD